MRRLIPYVAAIVLAAFGFSAASDWSDFDTFAGWDATVTDSDSIVVGFSAFLFTGFTPKVSGSDSLRIWPQWSTSATGPWNPWHSARGATPDVWPGGGMPGLVYVWCEPTDDPVGFWPWNWVPCRDTWEGYAQTTHGNPYWITFHNDPDLGIVAVGFYCHFTRPGKYYFRMNLFDWQGVMVDSTNVDSANVYLRLPSGLSIGSIVGSDPVVTSADTLFPVLDE